jgi:hypothetical protein
MSMELPISRLKPAARAQGDSAGADPLRFLRSIVGSLGNISGNFTVNNTNSTNRGLPTSTSFLGDMPLGYILGFSSDTSFGALGKGGTKIYTKSRHGSAQNSTHLGQVTVDVRWDLTRSKSLGTLGSSGQQSLTWPDVSVSWGALEKFLPLGRLATGLNAQTKFSRVERLTFSRLDTPDQSTVTKSWAPLLTFSGELHNHDRFTFSTDKSNTISDNRLGNGSTENSTRTYKLNIRHVIHGPPIPVNAGPADLGFRLRGDVEVNLDGSYQIQGSSTRLLSGDSPADEDTKRLDISASAGYALANNVRGNVISGYTRTENTRTALISQNIRLQATASLTF